MKIGWLVFTPRPVDLGETMTPAPTARFTAVVVHLLGPVMFFVPGLAVWFYAQDRDAWLAAQGRRAAGFQAFIFAGYMVLVPTIPLAGPTFFRFRAGSMVPSLPHLVWQHPLAALLVYGGTLVFNGLRWASILWSLASAVAAMLGRGCVYPTWPRLAWRKGP
jgi:uncharacterized Tic20 family protein